MATASAMVLLAGRAFAHPVDDQVARAAPQAVLRSWTFEPGVLVAVAAVAVAYVLAVRRVRRQPGGASGCEQAAFVAGWVATAAALISPLDKMGSVLFSAHMVQHEVLMIVAAPLLVLGIPAALLERAAAPVAGRFPHASRRIGRALLLGSSPPVAWVLHATAILAWHVPYLFDAAVHSDAVHALQHLSFFGTALLFWWGILRAEPNRNGYGVAVVSVFTTTVYTGVLGAWLTLTPAAWYSAYASSTVAWGLTPLEDQQLGGLIMWVPAGIIYTAAGLWLFAAWLRSGVPSPRVRSTVVVLAAAVVGVIATGCGRGETYTSAAAMTGGDPARGPEALSNYGCVTCHTIPGVKGARGLVGPPLTSIGSRVYLAGRLPNTPDNIRKWIQHPRAVDELTAMPDTGVTDTDARNIAAYLYTLR